MDSHANAIQKAKAALIRYPRFNALHADIRLCQEMSQMAGEPQCMVLEGITGAGKSTLVRTYAEMLSRYNTPSGTKVPAFYVETPSPATVKGMAACMLEQLGDPAANRGTLWSMNSRLVHFLSACDVRLVVLDDFHHLIDRETNRVLVKVSDWLKVLIKESNVPFLVVGIEGHVEPILRANPQLSRLFAVRETLQPFQWDPAVPETIAEFASFVKYALEGISVSFSDELPRTELLYRLYYATDGVVGNIMNLVRYATLLAQQANTHTLTLSIFAQAFEKRMAKHLPHKSNPFTPAAGSRFTPPAPRPMDQENGAGRRSRKRKDAPPAAAAVLKTS